MALFSSVIRQLFGRFAHFLRRRETPQRAQQCAAQELAAVETLQEECEAFNFTAIDRKCRKRCRKVPEKYQLGERKEEREVKINMGGSHKDEADIETVTLSLKKRGGVHQKKREMHSLEKSMGGSELKEAGAKKRKERKRKITESTPLLVVVKPLHTTVRSSFLKPIEGEPMLPSVSGHLALPAAHFKPLPPVTKPQKPSPAPEDVLSLPCSPLQEDPPKLLAVPPCPDEVVSLRRSSSQVCPPKRLPPSPTFPPDGVVPPSRKPQPFTSSPLEPPPELILVDLEDEENEYVQYTEKPIRATDLLKSERPQTPEAEMKPRKMDAWLEKDSKVQEEVWASEVVEVLGFEEEEGDPRDMGDFKAIQGHSDAASQIDEHMMKLFCVTSPDDDKNETQNNVNVQKKCKRKVPLVLFTWAVEKAKKREEKKIVKEKERKEKALLLERYMNDQKLKHLWINKHNRNYNSS